MTTIRKLAHSLRIKLKSISIFYDKWINYNWLKLMSKKIMMIVLEAMLKIRYLN
jgi:hypothetical protein